MLPWNFVSVSLDSLNVSWVSLARLIAFPESQLSLTMSASVAHEPLKLSVDSQSWSSASVALPQKFAVVSSAK